MDGYKQDLRTIFSTPHWREREELLSLGQQRLLRVDLFQGNHNIVIPIKTDGRYYGSISKEAVVRNIQLPRVVYGCTEAVPVAGRQVLFLAFWKDEDTTHRFTEFAVHVVECMHSVIAKARSLRLEEVRMPVLGGKRWEEALPIMEWARELSDENAEVTGAFQPRLLFVRR